MPVNSAMKPTMDPDVASGSSRFGQSSAELRRASSTTRIARIPAAMAAATGSREGTGPGAMTGMVAAATVDFACAAVSLAGLLAGRDSLVSAAAGAGAGASTAGGVAGCGGGTAGAFLAGAFFAGAAFLAALAGAFFATLAGAFFAAFAGAFLAAAFFAGGGSVGSNVGSGGDGCSVGSSSGRPCWSAIWLLLCSSRPSHHASWVLVANP